MKCTKIKPAQLLLLLLFYTFLLCLYEIAIQLFASISQLSNTTGRRCRPCQSSFCNKISEYWDLSSRLASERRLRSFSNTPPKKAATEEPSFLHQQILRRLFPQTHLFGKFHSDSVGNCETSSTYPNRLNRSKFHLFFICLHNTNFLIDTTGSNKHIF